MTVGKVITVNNVERKYCYTEKMKELFELHGINVDDEHRLMFEEMDRLGGKHGQL